MKEKKKLKLKKFYFHPITVFIFLTIILIVLSGILASFDISTSYNQIDKNTITLEPKLIALESIFSFAAIKTLMSSAMTNFLSFAPLGTLLISLIGLSIAEGTGLIETFSRKYLKRMPEWVLTLLVIFIATVSSLINEIGYAILIPMFALIYFINGRNPILGIITSFCGVSFGYGVSLFVGSMDIALKDYTELASHLVDENYHVPLSSNLIFLVVATIIITIVGTIIIEKLIAPKVGHYKREEEFAKTEQYRVINYEEEEQKKIERERNEKRGLRFALVVGIVLILLYIYALVPGLPYSGLLLDNTTNIYVDQLFGSKAYFQDSFTYSIALFFIITGIAYGIGAKTVKNDKEIIEFSATKFKDLGSLFLLIFVVSQFITIYKSTNIGMIITTLFSNLLSSMSLSGIPLIIVTLLFISISNIFLTSPTQKWMIFSPVVVPMFMQSNITPEFAQIVMRTSLSMTNGITPLLASFVIYIGYLNIYNLDKSKPYTIRKSLSVITPYFLIIAITWMLIIIGWYIIGAPIGGGVNPTL